MLQLESYPIIPHPSIKTLSNALNDWAIHPRTRAVVLNQNGQFKRTFLNLQPRWQLFENLSRYIVSGLWLNQEMLMHPERDSMLKEPLTLLSGTAQVLYWNRARQLVVCAYSPRHQQLAATVRTLQQDIATVRQWIKEVDVLGKLFWDLHSGNIEIPETIADITPLPDRFSVLNEQSRQLKEKVQQLILGDPMFFP